MHPESMEMEQIARQEEEKMLETRLQQLPFFNEKIPGANLEKFRISPLDWRRTITSPDSESALTKAIQNTLEHMQHRNEDPADEKIRERDLRSTLETLMVTDNPSDKAEPHLSSNFVQRAESLNGLKQEAFIRGYADFRYGRSGASQNLLTDIRDGSIDAKNLPEAWVEMAEGDLIRTLEDASVWGRTAELTVKLIKDVEQKTGVDIISRCRDSIERYLQNDENYKKEHGEYIKPQPSWDLERELKQGLDKQ